MELLFEAISPGETILRIITMGVSEDVCFILPGRWETKKKKKKGGKHAGCDEVGDDDNWRFYTCLNPSLDVACKGVFVRVSLLSIRRIFI